MEIPKKSDGTPDIEKLLKSIEAEVAQSVKDNGYEMPKYIPIKVELENLESPQFSEWLKYLNFHWNDWSMPMHFESHRPLLGKVLVKFKNLFQRLLRLTLAQYFERELKYQEHLVRHLNYSSKYVDQRDAKIFWDLNDKIDQEVGAVNKRTDELFDRLASEIFDLKERLVELEKKKVA